MDVLNRQKFIEITLRRVKPGSGSSCEFLTTRTSLSSEYGRDSSFYVQVRKDSPRQSFSIAIRKITAKSTYSNDDVLIIAYGFNNVFVYDSKPIGNITFTKLIHGYIASGTFSFKVPTKNGSDTLFITEGRFDYKLPY